MKQRSVASLLLSEENSWLLEMLHDHENTSATWTLQGTAVKLMLTYKLYLVSLDVTGSRSSVSVPHGDSTTAVFPCGTICSSVSTCFACSPSLLLLLLCIPANVCSFRRSGTLLLSDLHHWVQHSVLLQRTERQRRGVTVLTSVTELLPTRSWCKTCVQKHEKVRDDWMFWPSARVWMEDVRRLQLMGR